MTAAVAEAKREACRSCDAPIVWCTSERGKAMPVNADPEPGGNLLVHNPGGIMLAVVLPADKAFGRTDLHKSHFATCRQAASWRRKRSTP